MSRIPLNSLALLGLPQMPTTLTGGIIDNARLTGIGAGLVVPPLSSPPAALAAERKWIAVTWRFTTLHRNIQLTDEQRKDGTTKAQGVANCLRAWYYGENSNVVCAQYVGSWGKETQVRPPRDVDIQFLVPNETYLRFQSRMGNKQSQLLQEIKNVLAISNPKTDMRGDGQVIMVGFDSYSVEVVPVIAFGGKLWICDTNNGGSYKAVAPDAEQQHIDSVDKANAGNLRPLIRMLKAWQRECNVELKSFHLELLAADFIAQSPWRMKTFFYFDWLTRDFFLYLCQRANSFVFVPGTGVPIWLGNDWHSKAQMAFKRASKACEYERDNMIVSAGQEWQKIFGGDVPLM